MDRENSSANSCPAPAARTQLVASQKGHGLCKKVSRLLLGIGCQGRDRHRRIFDGAERKRPGLPAIQRCWDLPTSVPCHRSRWAPHKQQRVCARRSRMALQAAPPMTKVPSAPESRRCGGSTTARRCSEMSQQTPCLGLWAGLSTSPKAVREMGYSGKDFNPRNMI